MFIAFNENFNNNIKRITYSFTKYEISIIYMVSIWKDLRSNFANYRKVNFSDVLVKANEHRTLM